MACGCGATEKHTLEIVDHKYETYVSNNDATCQKNATETAECVFGCGEKHTRDIADSKVGHKYENYVSNNDATCQKDGTKTASCTGCDAKDTVEDPGTKKDHEYKDGACVYCGAEEPSNGGAGWIIAVVSVVVVGGAGAALYFLKFKKTGKKVKAEEE
jgi:hypothetical protein